MRHLKRKELLLYVIVWAVILLAPIGSMLWHIMAGDGEETNWATVFAVWRTMGVLIAAFFVHDIFLAPLIVYKDDTQRRRTGVYVLGLIVLFVGYMALQSVVRPDPPRAPMEPVTMDMRNRPPLPENITEEMNERMGPPEDRQKPKHKPKNTQPTPYDQHDFIIATFFLLAIGVNIGAKFHFRALDERERLEQMQRETLEQQLTYLKHQISPHFFMNTLNNIHALVDIDSERAKKAIVRLSRLMRFVLYDGDKDRVPVQREVAFLHNYIRLMRLRYADDVNITFNVAASIPEREIPPLILISFVENAFKHGISYNQASFVETSIDFSSDGRTLYFVCRNSKPPQPVVTKPGGVGLTNVRRRLDLIYGDTAVLNIADTEKNFAVTLNLPLF